MYEIILDYSTTINMCVCLNDLVMYRKVTLDICSI